MDAPLKAKSGHQGTAMALAPLAHVLFSKVMRHDPANPRWPDRDRFILSNGHASILQYSMLYLCGYGLELDDIKQFRQWGSLTPGHPEAELTIGIEVTTGPLGQGFANAVGMAIAERRLRTQFGDDVINHHTFVIAGDGCFEEGISHEAASLAGHQRLGNLICVYDDNHITIDGNTSLAYSDDVGMRFEAYGWNVVHLGEMADDCDGLEAALNDAKAVTDKPSLLILRSHVAAPSPDWTDRHEAHGNPFTAEQVTRTKEVMGIPDEPFWAPTDLVSAYRTLAAERGETEFGHWSKRKAASTLDEAAWDACWGATGIAGWETALPSFEQGEKIATRVAIEKAFNASLDGVPGLFAGAADLTGNTGTKLADQLAQSFDHPGGRQMYYGIREHAMGSTMVGMAKHGGVLPAGGTFFVFLDYMRPSVRLAALSHAKVIFVWTHDSVGVGEDGPTHPTDRTTRHVAGDPAPAGHPPSRCQRDGRSMEGGGCPRWSHRPCAQPSVGRRLHRRVRGRARCRCRPPGRPSAGGAGGHGQRSVVVRRGGRATLRRWNSGERCQHAVVGSLRRPERQLSRRRAARGFASSVGRSRGDVRVGAVRRRIDRHRPFRGQRTGECRHGQVGNQRR